MGQATAVPEFGYNSGVELFVHRLRRGRVPGTNRRCGLAGGGTIGLCCKNFLRTKLSY